MARGLTMVRGAKTELTMTMPKLTMF